MADEKRVDRRVRPGSETAAGAASERARGQLRAAAAFAAASAALIVASIVLVLSLPGSEAALGGLWQTVANGSAPAAGQMADAAQEEAPGTDGAASEGSAAPTGRDAERADAAGAPDGATFAGTASETVAAAGGASGAAAVGGGAAAPAPGAPSEPVAPAAVTVTVSVSARAVGGGTLASTSLTFERGATAYDALMGTGLPVSAENSLYGIYVRSIGGYAASGSSGWMYAVNGSEPSTSAANYVLEDGDAVSWYYSP